MYFVNNKTISHKCDTPIRMMVFCLLPLFMTTVCASALCYNYTFKTLNILNELKAIQIPSSVLPAQNVEYCARQCAEDDKCVSLSYHGNQCTIYRSSLSSSGITVPGSRSYIKQGALPSGDPCPLSQGYTSVLYPRVCYKLYNTDPWKTWDQSQARCQSDGGRLIILNTTEKHDYIAAIMTQTSSVHDDPLVMHGKTRDESKEFHVALKRAKDVGQNLKCGVDFIAGGVLLDSTVMGVKPGALIGLKATSSTSFAWTDGSTFLRQGSKDPSLFDSGCAYLTEDKVGTTSCSNRAWSLCEVV